MDNSGNHVLGILSWITFGCWLLIVCVLFFLQPRFADDYGILFAMDQTQGYWDYIRHYYLGFTGRIPQVTFAWMALGGGEGQRLIFQAMAFFILMGTLVLAAAIPLGRFPNVFGQDRLYVLLIVGAIWFGNPAPGETIFWTMGALAYLIPLFCCLLLLSPYTLWLLDPSCLAVRTSLATPIAVLLFMLGLLTGCCHEQVLVTLGFLAMLWLWVVVRSGQVRDVPAFLYAGLVGLCVGGLVLVLAPGNWVRLSLETHKGVTSLSQQVFYTGSYVWRYVLSPELLVWVALILTCGFLSQSPLSLRKRQLALSFLLAGMVSLLPVIPTHMYFAPRTALFAVVLIVMASAFVLRESMPLSTWQTNLLCLLVALALTSDGLKSLYAGVRLQAALIDREKQIVEQKQAGQRDIQVSPLPAEKLGRLIFFSDQLQYASDPTILPLIRRMYGVDRIQIDHSRPVWRTSSLLPANQQELQAK